MARKSRYQTQFDAGFAQGAHLDKESPDGVKEGVLFYFLNRYPTTALEMLAAVTEGLCNEVQQVIARDHSAGNGRPQCVSPNSKLHVVGKKRNPAA